MNKLSIIDWISILKQIRRWLQQADEILDLPDLSDPQQVYTWCHTVLVLARESAKLTPIEIDDQVIAWLLAEPFASFEDFKIYYRVFRTILELITGDQQSRFVASQAAEIASAEVLAGLAKNPAGLDPITVLTIIVQILRFILDLKGKTNG